MSMSPLIEAVTTRQTALVTATVISISPPPAQVAHDHLSFPGFPDANAEATLVAEGGVRMPAPHPPEFRQRAVELGRLRDKPIREIARDLGISESCLRNWLAQADTDDGRREGLTSHAAGDHVDPGHHR
jgi:Transposase